jgi:hypothetical protein
MKGENQKDYELFGLSKGIKILPGTEL